MAENRVFKTQQDTIPGTNLPGRMVGAGPQSTIYTPSGELKESVTLPDGRVLRRGSGRQSRGRSIGETPSILAPKAPALSQQEIANLRAEGYSKLEIEDIAKGNVRIGGQTDVGDILISRALSKKVKQEKKEYDAATGVVSKKEQLVNEAIAAYQKDYPEGRLLTTQQVITANKRAAKIRNLIDEYKSSITVANKEYTDVIREEKALETKLGEFGKTRANQKLYAGVLGVVPSKLAKQDTDTGLLNQEAIDRIQTTTIDDRPRLDRFEVPTPEQLEATRIYEKAEKELRQSGLKVDPITIEARATGRLPGFVELEKRLGQSQAFYTQQFKKDPSLGTAIGSTAAGAFSGAFGYSLIGAADLLPFSQTGFRVPRAVETTAQIARDPLGTAQQLGQQVAENPFYFGGTLLGTTVGYQSLFGKSYTTTRGALRTATGRIMKRKGKPIFVTENIPAPLARFAPENFLMPPTRKIQAQIMNRLRGFKQVEIQGYPALVKTGRDQTFVFLDDIHRNTILGDVSRTELRKILNLPKKSKVKKVGISTVLDEYPGFKLQKGKSYLATQSESKFPWGIPAKDPLYAQPSVGNLNLFSRQFSKALQRAGVDYSQVVEFGFRQPKAIGMFSKVQVKEALNIDKRLKKLYKEYQVAPTKTQRKIALAEAARILETKQFSGVTREALENIFKGVREPQVAIQKQGFFLNTTQPIRGSKINVKEVLGKAYFFDRKVLPGKQTLQAYSKAENVLGFGLRKTKFTSGLEKIYDVTGYGRDYKRIKLVDVTYGIPSGRPPKERQVLPRETVRVLEQTYDPKTKQIEYVLYRERSGKYGTLGGALDPIYDPKYYGLSKTKMRGGRIVLKKPLAAARQEVLEEIGSGFLSYERLPITAKGLPYRSFQGQTFQDFTRNIFVGRGKYKVPGAKVKVGEITGTKVFTAKEIAKAADVDPFTKQIILRAEKQLARTKGKPKVKTVSGLPTPKELFKTSKREALDVKDYYGYGQYLTPKDYVKGFYYGFKPRKDSVYTTNYTKETKTGYYKTPLKLAKEYGSFYSAKELYKPITLKEEPIRTFVGDYPKGTPYAPYETKTYATPYPTGTYAPPYTSTYSEPPYVPPRRPPIVPRSVESPEKKYYQKKTKTFYPVIREKGKWVQASKTPFTKNRAWLEAQIIADNTTAKTISIKSSGKTTYLDDAPNPLPGKFRQKAKKSKITKNPVYIERNRFAIDSIGEKQQLSAARYLKQMKQVMF